MSNINRFGRTPRERVLSRLVIDPETGCLLWTGLLDRHGYGQVTVGGSTRRVHRVVYEMLAGPIPGGLTLDHLCRVTRCASPAHLEPVTTGENTRRGMNANRDKTHCDSGHEFTLANTYFWHGKRFCRACNRAAAARLAARKKVAS